MKRVATYLCGAGATLALLAVSLLVDGFPRRFAGSWQPDESDAQGYILQLTPDSMVTARAPGHPVRVITSDTLIAHTGKCDIEAPRFVSQAPLFNAAWDYAWTRLSECPPTSFNVYMTAPCAPGLYSPGEVMAIAQDEESWASDAWPLASPEAIGWVTAASEYAVASGIPDLGRRIAEKGRRALDREATRLRLAYTNLWRGGGDGKLSGTLPPWFDEADRFTTVSASANALAAIAYSSLASLEASLGEPSEFAENESEKIASEMAARLWIPSHGYFSQYLYGRFFLIKSPLMSGAANALAAAFPAVTDNTMAARIVDRMPRLPYGVPVTFPVPSSPVSAIEAPASTQGYWALACGRAANERALWNALAILVREVGLAAFDEPSDNDSETFGAYIGAVSRILFGMNLTSRGLEFNPVVPAELDGDKKLLGVRYRNAVLNVTVSGTGSRVGSFFVDGTAMPERTLSPSLEGVHEIRIEMVAPTPETEPSSAKSRQSLPVMLPVATPPVPAIEWQSPLHGECINPSDSGFAMIMNGIRLDDTQGSLSICQRNGLIETILVPLDDKGEMAAHSSIPHATAMPGSALNFQAEWFAARSLAREYYRARLRKWQRMARRGRAVASQRPNIRLTQLVELTSDEILEFTMEATDSATCAIEFGYADGRDAGRRGQILRSVSLNGKRIGSVSMPRKGAPADTTLTLLTRPLTVALVPGVNTVTLSATAADLYPGVRRDTVMIDFLRITNL